MTTFEYYQTYELPSSLEKEKETEKWRQTFLKDFPREEISEITMDQFLYCKKGYGKQNTFCCQLWNNNMCSLGNSYPSIFGVYCSGGTKISLHKRFQKMFSDEQTAFKLIKKEIVNLLNDGEIGNLKGIESNKLISTFKTLLLATYFKYDYLPAPTNTALNAYCDAIQMGYNAKDNSIYRNVEIMRWAKTVPELNGWSNYQVMLFLDWLWKCKKTINMSDLQER